MKVHVVYQQGATQYLVKMDGSVEERDNLPDPETTGADRVHFQSGPDALAYCFAWPAVGCCPAARTFVWAIEGAPREAIARAGRRALMRAARSRQNSGHR